jgi:hypothetical protein
LWIWTPLPWASWYTGRRQWPPVVAGENRANEISWVSREPERIHKINRIIAHVSIKIESPIFSNRVTAQPSSNIRIVGAENGQVEATGGMEVEAGEAEVGFHCIGANDLVGTAPAIRIIEVAGADHAGTVRHLANAAQMIPGEVVVIAANLLALGKEAFGDVVALVPLLAQGCPAPDIIPGGGLAAA